MRTATFVGIVYCVGYLNAWVDATRYKSGYFLMSFLMGVAFVAWGARRK